MDRREIFGLSVGWFITIALIVLGLIFGTWLYLQFEGNLLSKQFQNVKHSQGYVEATNTQARELITEYHKAETGYLEYKDKDQVTAASYQGQMTSYLNQIWDKAGSIDKSERGEDVQRFLDEHPNR